uniref:Hemoglobin subunit alpha n=1 Tax=Squalus acanthias TaxID=7797 RepID=HBA_SQUAC|nr:RecName: Full=Hemoglobin subunit alpha; AltName: Full=Alpha-globin; AltName: Full=Hemoglobin alpha chain [Squalus acanthias]
VLSAADKTAIKHLTGSLRTNAEAWGAESLARMFATTPSTKTYFSKFTDFSANGKRVKAHGGKVLNAVADATDHLDNVAGHLDPLAVLHGTTLCVDPHNFPLLTQCILVTLAAHLTELKPETHCALDKFLCEVATALGSHYR